MRIAFIIGCARSGTSILGELIAAHPEVNYQGEHNQALWHSQSDKEHHRLGAGDVTLEKKLTLRKLFGELPGYVVDKCPTNSLRTPFLSTVFPEAKFIHIIRDGRDVACSLMPGVGGQGWNHLKPPQWKWLFEQYQGIARCARLWEEVVKTAYFDLQEIDHLQIHYETLVASPDDTAQKIMDYVGLPLAVPVLDFCRKIQNDTAGSYHAEGQNIWYKDNHRQRIGRWRENLSQEEQAMINEILESTLRLVGYK